MDGAGDAYVTGSASSTNFPTTTGAFQTSSPSKANGGSAEAFVTKLNATGTALIYSTYLGDSDDAYGTSIAVDGSGNAYVTGYTYYSLNFPTAAGAYQTSFGGTEADAFVTKLNATGTALIYSTYLGGDDDGFGIAVDGSGNAYVTGLTDSANFPTTAGAYQTSLGGAGADNAFVTKLNASGTGLIYST